MSGSVLAIARQRAVVLQSGQTGLRCQQDGQQVFGVFAVNRQYYNYVFWLVDATHVTGRQAVLIAVGWPLGYRLRHGSGYWFGKFGFRALQCRQGFI